MNPKIGEVYRIGKTEVRILRVRQKHDKITVEIINKRVSYTWRLNGFKKVATRLNKLELLLRGLDEL